MFIQPRIGILQPQIFSLHQPKRKLSNPVACTNTRNHPFCLPTKITVCIFAENYTNKQTKMNRIAQNLRQTINT